MMGTVLYPVYSRGVLRKTRGVTVMDYEEKDLLEVRMKTSYIFTLICQT